MLPPLLWTHRRPIDRCHKYGFGHSRHRIQRKYPGPDRVLVQIILSAALPGETLNMEGNKAFAGCASFASAGVRFEIGRVALQFRQKQAIAANGRIIFLRHTRRRDLSSLGAGGRFADRYCSEQSLSVAQNGGILPSIACCPMVYLTIASRANPYNQFIAHTPIRTGNLHEAVCRKTISPASAHVRLIRPQTIVSNNLLCFVREFMPPKIS